ncbi:MAG: hypothetical protein Q4P36_00070 [Bowdeniella nasicola]|nr:hypothetical protein [Bowdeniella nasicola]
MTSAADRLRHPRDLAAWSRWQARQGPGVRRAVRAVRGWRTKGEEARATLLTASSTPRILVALEAESPTQVAALLAPLHHLPDPRMVAILAPRRLEDALLPFPARETHQRTVHLQALDDTEQLACLDVVVGVGAYLALGARAHRLAQRRALRHVTVQHGLLTPYAPPLPTDTHLLAWNAADAEYWRAGRADVTSAVAGSVLLAEARDDGTEECVGAPVFLGQLHGAELARSRFAHSALTFCRATHATYRPHPAERDLLSRTYHAWFRRRGIDVESDGPALRHLAAPVASVFSTGVLEAAASGRPAWVTCERPPRWLEGMWERYNMSRWQPARDCPPTPAPTTGVSPARAIATALMEGMRP